MSSFKKFKTDIPNVESFGISQNLFEINDTKNIPARLNTEVTKS